MTTPKQGAFSSSTFPPFSPSVILYLNVDSGMLKIGDIPKKASTGRQKTSCGSYQFSKCSLLIEDSFFVYTIFCHP